MSDYEMVTIVSPEVDGEKLTEIIKDEDLSRYIL